MADVIAGNVPAFAQALVRQEDEQILEALQRQHLDFQARLISWEILLHAFEGSGGFLDGNYVWPYPREDSGSYEARKKMARYHNYTEALIDLYVRYIWTRGIKRESKNEQYNLWLEDVDGAKTSIDQLLKRALSVSLLHGHVGILVDKTSDEPTGPAKADDKGRVIANVFPALSIADWRFKNNKLEAVKLYEAPDPVGILEEPLEPEQQIKYLAWDTEGWARFDAEGDMIAADLPNLGLVPLAILRPKPSYLNNPMLGRSLVPSYKLVLALFNRASEEDEVLREQAFSVVAIDVPEDGDVEAVKKSLGNSIGTTTALVAKGTIKYITPDQAVAQNIRDNQSYLIQETYRAAHIRYKNNSLAAESGEAKRLDSTELNETLQGIAGAMQEIEKQIAMFWCAWNAASPEQAQLMFEAGEFESVYPTEFFLDDLMMDLEALNEAQRMKLGPTMGKRLKKTAVQRIDSNIPPDELEKINKEIDGMSDGELDPTAVSLDVGDPEGQGIQKAVAQADGDSGPEDE